MDAFLDMEKLKQVLIRELFHCDSFEDAELIIALKYLLKDQCLEELS